MPGYVVVQKAGDWEDGRGNPARVAVTQHLRDREFGTNRLRSDPLDAKPSRHAEECEFAYATDAAVLRVISKIRDGAGGDYCRAEVGAYSAWLGVSARIESVG